MRLFISLLVVCLTALPSIAQSNSHPAKLSGFLKPGMYLGVRAFEKSDGVRLTVYTEKDFQIAIDARTINLDELALKYPSVKSLRDKRLKEFVASLDAKRDNLAPNTKFGEPTIELVVDRSELLCKVEHVGDDYVLVRYGNEFASGRVLATGFISTINWHADDELRLSTSVRHVAEPADRTKP